MFLVFELSGFYCSLQQSPLRTIRAFVYNPVQAFWSLFLPSLEPNPVPLFKLMRAYWCLLESISALGT